MDFVCLVLSHAQPRKVKLKTLFYFFRRQDFSLLLLTAYVIIPLMKRNWLIIIVIVLVIILGGLIIKSKFFSRPGTGALQVSSTPKATIFIDAEQIGVTPFFTDKIESGEHTIKLVPETTIDNLTTWEGKVNLAPGIVTAIDRTLGPTESESSGYIVSLEKISNRNAASLAVISIPDGAVVNINGEPKGFAPSLDEDLTPGNYQVAVSSAGYEEKNITAQIVAGYKLTVSVKLAQKIEGIAEATPSGELEEGEEEDEEEGVSPSPSPEGSPKASPTPLDKPYVRIKDTPTGWLKVRSEPSSDETVLAKVDVGEVFPYLDEEENGWYKIEYEEGEEGWVSGVYCELVE